MRFLRLLLWLLPTDFRKEYGHDLQETVAERWRETRPRLGQVEATRFWIRQWLAVAGAAIALRTGNDAVGDLGAPAPPNRKVPGGGLSLRDVWIDVRQAKRALIARPGFTLVTVLTLGLGVGATTTMFSAARSVLFKALPYQRPEEVVVLRQIDARDGSLTEGVSASNVVDLATMTKIVSQVAVVNPYGFSLMVDGRAASLHGWKVSAGFFEAIGGGVQLGRTFLPEEYLAGRESVVVLSHHTWQARFGGTPEIIGQTLKLDGTPHAVVGVLPASFKYPSSAEIWAPRPPQPWDEQVRGTAHLHSIARLADGVTLPEAQAELDQVANELATIHPAANAEMALRAVPLREHLFGHVESPLLLLFGAVGLVLLIAIANVAGLQVARGAARAREYALRGALGADAGRILRLVAIESLLLASIGACCGIGLAYWGVHLIRIFGPNHLPRIDELRIDTTVLTFAVVAAVVSATLAGIAPALRASKMGRHIALSEGARGSTHGRCSHGFRERLVVAEIALALILAIGAGLLVRSFERLIDNELGFDPSGKLAVQVFAFDQHDRPDQGFLHRGLETIAAIPGVEAVGVTTSLPLANDESIASMSRPVPFAIDDREPAPLAAKNMASLVAIDGAYPRTMGIAVQRGRPFSSRDQAQSPSVAMVNEAFLRRYFPDRDPLGRRITLEHRGESQSREVVGVLADVRPEGFESKPRPEIYLPLAQAPSGALTFVIETTNDPAALIKEVRTAIWATNPAQAIWAALPMMELSRDWIHQRRFYMALFAAFAGLALSLAAIGIYGLMSFSVEQRVSELGIRRALGGQTHDILSVVLRRSLALALTGTGLGLLGSLALTRLMQGLLFEVDAFDPLTFGALSFVVVGVALLAALLPAHRATQIDPMAALRMD